MGDVPLISTFHDGLLSRPGNCYQARALHPQGYKNVSLGEASKMSEERPQSPIHWSLARLRDDTLAKTLLVNSHLTKVQFVTFLIDVLWPGTQVPPKDGRPRLRSHQRRVSKGAFNRSLSQARRNVIKSIYTVFLLAYFGLFDSPKLEPFLRLGDEMKTVLDARRETGRDKDSEATSATKVLEDALEAAVGELARMTSFKRQRDIT